MKIAHYELKLVDPFGIARETRTTNKVVLVDVDGGIGESSPTKFYGESADSVEQTLRQIEPLLEMGDLDYIENIDAAMESLVKGNQSAKAAVDIALHDRLAKKLGVPLYKLFGRDPNCEMVSSFTIGIDTLDVMMQKVEKSKQYDILKIKLGKDYEHDLAVMKEIRKAVGDKTVRVDMNGGYTLETARVACRAMADLGVEYVEQPLYKGSHAELRELHKDAPLSILVDEDSMVAADLPKLVGAVDGINIKLMKSAGIAEARRMIAIARAFDMKIMIGCMIETSVAITAAAHLAPFADYLDLDGSLLTSNDPFTGAIFEPNGRFTIPNAPGLGVALKPDTPPIFN
ncbi:MAG: dipeptide epimerase [Candidatus Sumerlaeaceae bacterium]|nr:dipeptide epimerase [Candidatus Sumerlaeaceae bacterium]